MVYMSLLTAVTLEFVVLEIGTFAWLFFSTPPVPKLDPPVPRSKHPGRTTFPSFCWPSLMALNLVLTTVSFEFVVLKVIWWLISSTLPGPSCDPYVPRSQRSPNYLETFLRWLNATIEHTATTLAPKINVCRTTRPTFAFTQTGPPTSRRAGYLRQGYLRFRSALRHLGHSLFSCNIYQRFKYAIRLILHYISSILHFRPWRSRSRSPRIRRTRRILATSAINAGVARAHQAASSTDSSRVHFDSDSFDILVDGGATSCISNTLSDFITPPTSSTVRVKGFNGTTSSTKVGTVVWNILDDAGKRHALTIRNTYYVPACPLRLLSPQHYSQQEHDARGT
jgi:hypothetical protein